MSGDDHERMACQRAGAIGHWSCGMCPEHGVARFECGCLLRLDGETDGLGRATPGTIRLALIFERKELTVGPRDPATQEWLANRIGGIVCGEALRKLSETWLKVGIKRTDLPIMAAELQKHISDRYLEHSERHNHGEGHGWYHPPLTIEVRACEYVAPPPTHLELREIQR